MDRAPQGPAAQFVVGGAWGGEDQWHRPVAGDSAYRESYYFDFADDETDLAGFTSVGWKPGRGALGATTVIFDEQGAWIAQAVRTTTGDFPLVEVDGLSYRRSGDGFGSWDIDLAGLMVPAPELGIRARHGGASDPVDVQLHVAFRPRSPEVCTTGEQYHPAFAWHLEQAGDTDGRLAVGTGRRRAFRGRGHRDRSFGARAWTHFPSWVYLAGHTADITINLWALQGPDDRWVFTGWVQRDGGPVEAVQDCRLHPGQLLAAGADQFPATLDFELASDRGVVTGSVGSARLVALEFTTRHGAARLDRGVGDYLIDGQPGSGQVEYQQRLGQARPEQRWRLGER
jgi:hypothetical protein